MKYVEYYITIKPMGEVVDQNQKNLENNLQRTNFFTFLFP